MAQMMLSTTAGTAVARTARTSTDSNQLIAVGESITVTAAQLTLNALFGNIRVPKNAEIVDVMFYASDLDTGTPAIVFTMGDAGDVDRLMTANTGAQSGAVPYTGIAATGFGYKYTDETLIQLQCSVIPATAAAGTLKYVVRYVSQ